MVSTREGNPHRKNFRYCWFDVGKYMRPLKKTHLISTMTPLIYVTDFEQGIRNMNCFI
jgi:hypothetical protein